MRCLFLILTFMTQHACCAVDIADVPAYQDWAAAHARDYEHTAMMGEAAVHVTVDEGAGFFQIAVAVQAVGWAGFGIAEVGGMPGSDIVLFTADDQKLVDAHAVAYAAPVADDCSNWELVGSEISSAGDLLVFEARRALDTGDESQDRPIRNDSNVAETLSHKVILAWGDDVDVSYHGKNAISNNLRFYGQNGDESFTGGEDHIDLLTNAFAVPTSETTYESFCFQTQDLLDLGLPDGNSTGLHVIAFEHIVDHDEHIHHLVLYGAMSDLACNAINTAVYAWAPGVPPLQLPEETGLRVGGDESVGSFQSFRLEVHYDNPDGIGGIQDSSGVRMYYSAALRDTDAGIIIVGDGMVLLKGETVGDGLSQHDFLCPSTCSTEKFGTDGVKIFFSALHMHQSGVSIVLTQIRDDKAIQKFSADYYDFDQAGIYMAPLPAGGMTLESGDALKLTCYYNSNADEVFGFASSDEMCMGFLYYYPLAPDLYLGYCGYAPAGDIYAWMGGCRSSYHQTLLLNSEEDLGRKFSITTDDPAECPQMAKNDSVRLCPLLSALWFSVGVLAHYFSC